MSKNSRRIDALIERLDRQEDWIERLDREVIRQRVDLGRDYNEEERRLVNAAKQLSPYLGMVGMVVHPSHIDPFAQKLVNKANKLRQKREPVRRGDK